jgi:hypothetical protein
VDSATTPITSAAPGAQATSSKTSRVLPRTEEGLYDTSKVWVLIPPEGVAHGEGSRATSGPRRSSPGSTAITGLAAAPARSTT